MDASHARRLIRSMLDSRGLMPETREELAEYLADLDRGALHPDDAAYVAGLARRLGYAAGGAPAASGDADDDIDEIFPAEEDEPFSATAAAVQAEVALRALEQARGLVAKLREPQPESGTAAPAAPALEEIDRLLGEAADALTRRG